MISIVTGQICYPITNDGVFIYIIANKVWKYLFQKHIETSLKAYQSKKTNIVKKVYKSMYKELYL